MESSIVPLVWSGKLDLDHRSSFETDARRLRYQALGTTCRDLGISNLLVAHHGDDQAETIMIRLIKGRWRSGLVGMSSEEWIPECHGIHGVHHSGLGNQHWDGHSLMSDLPTEKGGIRLLRPLLSFEKSRLVATCQDLNVSWVEDHTNKDPTLTGRNAVRHVFQNHKLPEALDTRSLLSLCERMQERVQFHRNTAEAVFNKTLIKLDLQTGSLHVRFPPSAELLGRPIHNETDRIESRNTAFLFIQRVVELVSPKESRSIGQLSIAVDSIYPLLREPDNETQVADSFTVSGVLCRPWGKSYSVFAPPGAFPQVHEMDYFLCRQPLDDREKTRGGIFLTIPPVAKAPETYHAEEGSSESWRLFDGRFWIQVRNLTDHDMVIRTLNSEDLRRSELASKQTGPTLRAPDHAIRVTLRSVKPAECRNTIPALFKREKDGIETLLALPTLGVRLADPADPLRVTWHFKARYKKIDLSSSFDLNEVIHASTGLRRSGKAAKPRPKNRDR
ncbi:hypothetical protein K491DRAFT_677990 [Lophiostoma macrostomum CBS 122681]|uniref:tRNA(Ile)-lysidine synthetase n=1 Tax=Lophiostoma macrostomum CBS 122681 TaxID=1314788 RepID=A0A6A6T9S3_9PLEO|nr:hypothetical protein K491DRAFT_677990 [Lophiostoma macrostomum CBS 122681]